MKPFVNYVSFFLGLAWLMGCLTSANASLVFEYDASTDGSSPWSPNVNTSGDNRDWALTGATYNSGDVSPAYGGINSSWSFSGSGSGGTTGSFGRDDLPLGGANTNAVGASSAWELWIKPNTLDLDTIDNQVIFETGGTTNGMAIVFEPNAASDSVDLVFSNRSNNGSSGNYTIVEAISGNDLLDDFMQIVVSIDPNNAGEDDSRLYLNGNLIGGFDQWDSWQQGNNNAGLGQVNNQIGSGLSGTYNPFNGEIALFRIYNEPLSDAEVFDRYFAVTVPEPSTALVLVGLISGLGLFSRKTRSLPG